MRRLFVWVRQKYLFSISGPILLDQTQYVRHTPFHLTTETDPVVETLHCIRNSTQRSKFRKPVVICVTYRPHNPTELRFLSYNFAYFGPLPQCGKTVNVLHNYLTIVSHHNCSL
jgi:hypothetical protein